MSGRLIGVLVAMAAFLAAGLSTGTRVYYLMFYLLLAMILLGLGSVVWTLATLKVEMKGVKARALRGESLTVVLTVRHLSLLPVAGVSVDLSVPSAVSGHQEVRLHTLPFTSRFYRHMIRCPHRGIYEAGITRLSAADVFGLFSISLRAGPRRFRIEVQPRVPVLSAMELGAIDLGPEFMTRSSEDTASPSDVRTWQDGDSLKKVHWKLSMRRREIMVRTYEESARPDTLILPDLSPVTAMMDQRLSVEDEICESCLGMARAQLEKGYPVRMPLVCARPGELVGRQASDLPPFADALMRVSFDSPAPYEEILMQMTGRMQRTGGIVLVTSRLSMRTADMAMRMQHMGARVRLIWVSDEPREESLEILERLKMEGVQVQQRDPWQTARPATAPAGPGAEAASL